MTISAILKAAKARLTPETWGQGNGNVYAAPSTLGGKLCAGMAFGNIGAFEQRQFAAALLTAVATGQSFSGGIVPWNDDPVRTLKDVHDAYDAAIAIAEAQEAAALAETPEGEPA